MKEVDLAQHGRLETSGDSAVAHALGLHAGLVSALDEEATPGHGRAGFAVVFLDLLFFPRPRAGPSD